MIKFLKSVIIASLGAFGGPEAHYGIFLQEFVDRKKYVNDEEMLELIALCNLLPGPSSTQTITAIGYKVGGRKLAIYTLLTWAIPAILAMTGLSFLSNFLVSRNISLDFLENMIPMAIGFIAVASYKLTKKVIDGKFTLILTLISAVVVFFYSKAFVFPVLLILGAIAAMVYYKVDGIDWKTFKPKDLKLLFVFLALIPIAFLAKYSDIRLISLFGTFFIYGLLVFGGGNVLIPYMISDMVESFKYLSEVEFFSGYSIVQAMPGPMFSFSGYVGAMGMRDYSWIEQLLGGLISGLSIFLPGVILIFIFYPIWADIRKQEGVSTLVKGVNAVANGLILGTFIKLVIGMQFNIITIGILIFTIVMLLIKKIPVPLIMLSVLAFSYFISII
ncbi:MAG: chromate efflux transporter [Tissierellia bacterium]|nr:chromate efflux transporter [Tissierellia bacterium]